MHPALDGVSGRFFATIGSVLVVPLFIPINYTG
jgi:hypothetical protein